MPSHSESISVNEFWSILKEKLTEICKRVGWKFDNPVQRGYAFQLFVAEVLCADDRGFDSSPDESILYAKDLGADIVLEDSTRKHLLIAQCKYKGRSGQNEIAESEVTDFFSRHDDYMDRDWIRKYGSEMADDLLGDYAEKIDADCSVDYFFVSTGKSPSERIRDIPDTFSERYDKRDLNIKCHLLDFSRLKELYQRSQSLEIAVPESVELTFPSGRFFVQEEPYKTVVGLIKGNELRNIYKRQGFSESLFAWNIRGYLGARTINKEIIKTAEESPADFFYYNNGVSAICTDFSIDDNRVIAHKFQIINGAQTVGALAKSRSDKDVHVLFRLTKTKTINTDKGINRDMIRFNNTQNAIKLSDFRSNDNIQVWLRQEFQRETSCGWMQKHRYVPKRGFGGKAKPGEATVTLEDLAKIRYAFHYEPTVILADPRQLWTLKSEGGLYEKAFGIEGELVDIWAKRAFRNVLVSILFFNKVNETAKKEKQKNDDRYFFNRLKYHSLALAGIFLRAKEISDKKLITDQDFFEEIWERLWKETRGIIYRTGVGAREESAPTLYAIARSTERWTRIKDEFLFIIEDL